MLLATFITIGVFSGQACGKKSTATPPIPTDPVDPPVTPTKSDVSMWLTTADKSVAFAKQGTVINFSNAAGSGTTTISIDGNTTYQTIDGFGFCLTGGSASLINAMTAQKKDDLLKELFSTDDNHIGISYLRISIGASDLSATDYTYDDISPDVKEDVELKNFSIDMEKTDLLPILKKILAINPNIKILGSPWTAPTWMKLNTLGFNGFKGGTLNPAYYEVYAKYFVKYIQAMKAEGITIDAVTPQNEPLNAYNNPAMYMESADQAKFVQNLGTAFKIAGLNTKIIVWDHNADNTAYPMDIFKDAAANPFVDGSAFHLYNGDINNLQAVHDAYPAKNLYFTEQYTPSTGGFGGDLNWHVTNLIVGATRNWCRNVLEWNLANNPDFGPHTEGGCDVCKGALTINSASDVTRNVSYYIIAHASKFVRPGAVRISSTAVGALPNVAFKNTDGSKVLIVLNSSGSQQTFNFKIDGKSATSTLANGSVATYVWQ